MKDQNIIISIGRAYGSGGKEISIKIAQKLGIRCYDSELLSEAAKQSGLCEEVIQDNDETPNNSFLYSLVMNTYSVSGRNETTFADMLPLNQKVFLAQFEAIKEIAERESCVIVGRCADYALEDNPGLCSIYIHAPEEFRLGRIKKDNPDEPDVKLKELIRKTDKKRANYYNYYSGNRWGDSRNYDLTIDSSILGIDGTVDFIIEFVNRRFPKD